MPRDHSPIRVSSFGGLFDGGERELAPVNHLLQALNLWYLPGRGLRTRPPAYSQEYDIPFDNVLRMKSYTDGDGDLHILVLNEDGELYDASVSLLTPILDIAEMVDFSIVPMFGRAYITPHTGLAGLEDEVVYVYQNSGTARAAAGVAPTPTDAPANTVTNTAFPNEITVGRHGVAVAFETDTGFITKPGFFYEHFSDGTRGDMVDIPLGGSEVVARHILMTKARAEFDAALENLEYFFVPNGRIGDNVTDTFSISALDGDLVDDASYLLGQLETIPAGLALTNYNGRLCVGGEFDNLHSVRISRSGDPESIDDVEGTLVVNPGDSSSGISALWVHRESLIIHKVGRSYSTSDAGDVISDWSPDLIDSAVGAGPHSVGKIAQFGETLQDIGFVANASGLHLFNGTFAGLRLSQKIHSLWERITTTAAHTIELVIDSKKQVLYAAVPLDGAERPTHILHANFLNGLTPDAIRWSLWEMPFEPQSINVISEAGDEAQTLWVAGYDPGQLFKMEFRVAVSEVDDWISASESYPVQTKVEFAKLPNEMQDEIPEGIFHHCGCTLRVRGAGTLNVRCNDLDQEFFADAAPYALSENPRGEKFFLVDVSSERASFEIEVNEAGGWLTLTRFTHWYKFLYAERPQ